MYVDGYDYPLEGLAATKRKNIAHYKSIQLAKSNKPSMTFTTPAG